jgi:ABC-2 type transport system permease protein
MNGYAAFLGKEWMEIRRTWRIWVVPGMLLFFGLTSPILALVTPSLISSLAGSQPGMTITLPPPTPFDAGAQFLKSLNQLVIFALILGGAGSISGERATGTVVLAVTKPVSRSALVMAKLTADLLLLVASTLAATLLCGVMTAALFETVAWRPLFSAVGLWLAFAILVTSAMSLFSVWFRSRGAAAGAGLAFFFVTLLAAIWPPAARYSFIGLPSQTAAALAGGMVAWWWSVGTAFLASFLFAIVSMKAFERQEL